MDTKLLVVTMIALGAGLAWSVIRVLGAWLENHLVKHDLIVESKRRRIAYFTAVAERQADHMGGDDASHDSVIIEDIEPAQAA